MTQPPPYQPYQGSDAAAGQLTCPKCRGTMRTYERNGIHLEQCDTCRGVFLDVGIRGGVPAPLGPTSAIFSPACTVRSMPRSTGSSGRYQK